jgi:hypothetical protein
MSFVKQVQNVGTLLTMYGQATDMIASSQESLRDSVRNLDKLIAEEKNPKMKNMMIADRNKKYDEYKNSKEKVKTMMEDATRVAASLTDIYIPTTQNIL